MSRTTPKYFLGFFPRAIQPYYEELNEGLLEHCGIPALSNRVVAHITIVPPFPMYDLRKFKEIIREQANLFDSFKVEMGGFGWFADDPEDQTLYLEVRSSPGLEMFTDVLTQKVRDLTGNKVAERVGGDFRPHVSIARHLMPRQAYCARLYALSRAAKSLVVDLEALTLFRQNESMYTIAAEFPLKTVHR